MVTNSDEGEVPQIDKIYHLNQNEIKELVEGGD